MALLGFGQGVGYAAAAVQAPEEVLVLLGAGGLEAAVSDRGCAETGIPFFVRLSSEYF
jgi:hypothetical protein